MLKRLSGRKVLQGIVKEEDVFNHFFSNFFDEFLSQSAICEPQLNSFKVDILEDTSHYWLEADLPGFKIEQITITYEAPFLTITAQNTTDNEMYTRQFIRKERQHGVFSRSFRILNINENQIEHQLNDGLLTVKIPKA